MMLMMTCVGDVYCCLECGWLSTGSGGVVLPSGHIVYVMMFIMPPIGACMFIAADLCTVASLFTAANFPVQYLCCVCGVVITHHQFCNTQS